MQWFVYAMMMSVLRDSNPRRLLDRVRAVSRQRWQIAAAIAAAAAAAMTDSLLEAHFHVMYML